MRSDPPQKLKIVTFKLVMELPTTFSKGEGRLDLKKKKLKKKGFKG
jgi:hypothetical protein